MAFLFGVQISHRLHWDVYAGRRNNQGKEDHRE